MNTIELLEIRTLLAVAFDYAVAFGDKETLDSANAVAVDALGNTYFAGTFRGRIDVHRSNRGEKFLSSFPDTYDAFIVKYDPAGKLLWSAKFGHEGDESIDKLVVGPSGDLVMSGTFEGTVDFNPGRAKANLTSHGKRDAFILRLTSAGKYVWAGHIGGGRDDAITALAVGPGGDVFYSGYARLGGDVDPTSGTRFIKNRGVDDTIISRLNGANGRIRWLKIYGENPTLETVMGLTVDATNNVYVVGNFNETVQFDRSSHRFDRGAEGGIDIYFARLNGNGRFQWVRTIGGNKEDIAADMVQDASGNLYVTGNFAKTVDFDPGPGETLLAAPGDGSAFIVKLDGDADLAWARQIEPAVIDGNAERGFITARAISIDAGGNVYTAGEFVRTIDFDPGSALRIIDVDKEGNTPIIPGQFISSDGYLHKLDAGGAFLDVTHFGGEDGTILPHDLAVDASGAVYTVGAFAGFVDLDPTSGLFSRSTREERRDSNVFLIKLAL